jgi:hypothetical protein
MCRKKHKIESASPMGNGLKIRPAAERDAGSEPAGLLRREPLRMRKLRMAGWIVAFFMLCGCVASAPSESSLTRIVDGIDLPFIDDPQVIGTWKAVDMVETVDRFDPERTQWEGPLILTAMTFHEGGTTSVANWTWTKGVIINPNDQTASRYLIREIQAAVYLFFEWKTGDYTIRHQTPWFYVMKKA